MPDDAGRAQRKEVELLQGRLKEAKEDLALEHSESFLEDLQALTETADALALALTTEAKALKAAESQLVNAQHGVEEAERRALVPKTLKSVGPAVSTIALAGTLGAIWLMAELITTQPTVFHYAGLVAASALPPAVLAFLIRRRFTVNGTFRNPS